MDTIIPLFWTIGAGLSVFLLRDLQTLFVFCLGLGLLIILAKKSLRPFFQAIGWTFPFVFPLLGIHSFLNAGFPETSRLLGFITFRHEGLIFATLVSLRIFTFTIALVAWRYVDRERLFSDAIKAKIPLNVLVLLAVATSTIRSISEKGKAVYTAQQARGIPAGPGVIARFLSLPAVILPVVTSTILDGARRGGQMKNRGLGTTMVAPPFNVKRRKSIDYFLALSVFPLLLSLWLFK